MDGWNSLGDSYMLRYVKDGDERARPVVLSMLAVGEKLLVDATRVGSEGEAVHTLELKCALFGLGWLLFVSALSHVFA